KNAVAKEKAADPAFVKRINALTLTSPEVRFRACILYQYNASVEYVKNGVINDTTISDIGTLGIPDYLHITDYKGKGWLSTRLLLRHYVWAIRVDIPALQNAGEWEVYYEARHSNDTRNPSGIFAYGGVYNYGTNFAEKTSFPLRGEDFTSEKYTLHSLGTLDFKKATQIYFAANNNATVPELLLGRIFLKRK
ncbi:MAG: hypothetical protein J6S21_05645, partial [Victivallales bacterium]|nr:hypothetical protein [Victivallales bacterium]